MALELVSEQFEFLEDSRASLFVVKNSVFKEEIGRNRLMNRRLTIDGQDEASFGESVLLIDDHPIADEGLRCILITGRRKRVDWIVRWNFIGRSR